MESTSSSLRCAYRRVHLGRTFCTRVSDEYNQEVWPGICAGCAVPGWLAEGICRHLDIGVEIEEKMGGEIPHVFSACRFFGERLDDLERCRICPEFSLWEGEEQEEEGEPTAVRRLAASLPQDLLVEALGEVLEQHVERESRRLMPRCFRAGVTECLFSAELQPDWVLVVPPSSLRSAEPYRGLVEGLLQEGGLQALFFPGSLTDVDALCDLCLGVQRSPQLVVDLSEWDAAALFVMALGGALGRRLVLIRGRDPTPPFVPKGLPVHEYATGEELALILMRQLGIELPAEAEEEVGEEEPAAQDTASSTKEKEAARAGGTEEKSSSAAEEIRDRKKEPAGDSGKAGPERTESV